MRRLFRAAARRLKPLVASSPWRVDVGRPHTSTVSWAKGEGYAMGARTWHEHDPVEVVLQPPDGDVGYDAEMNLRLRETFPACFLAQIPQARIWQVPYAFNFVVAPDGRPFCDLTFRTFTFERLAAENPARWQVPPPPAKLAGTTADLTTLGQGGNYSHWLLDVLPKIGWLRERAGELGVDRVLVNKLTPFVRESLALHGWEPPRVVALDELGPHLAFERLVVSTHLCTEYAPPFLVEAARESLGAPEPAMTRRIYISRGDAGGRRVLNEAEVIVRLAQCGFEVVTLAGMPMRAQAELFASAKVVLGPHGAAFTNVCFCQPGATLWEWFPRGYWGTRFRSMAQARGVNYGCQVFEHRGEDRKYADFEVDLEAVDHALERMGL